jgi:hypothetical protein
MISLLVNNGLAAACSTLKVSAEGLGVDDIVELPWRKLGNMVQVDWYD